MSKKLNFKLELCFAWDAIKQSSMKNKFLSLRFSCIIVWVIFLLKIIKVINCKSGS